MYVITRSTANANPNFQVSPFTFHIQTSKVDKLFYLLVKDSYGYPTYVLYVHQFTWKVQYFIDFNFCHQIFNRPIIKSPNIFVKAVILSSSFTTLSSIEPSWPSSASLVESDLSSIAVSATWNLSSTAEIRVTTSDINAECELVSELRSSVERISEPAAVLWVSACVPVVSTLLETVSSMGSIKFFRRTRSECYHL